MSTQTLNDNDFDSPGYEFLRSYQNMSRLYTKLVALNYQNDFCPLYKCPPIHKYYFSLPNRNLTEQQFLFTCLCAWLIKDKCQMNLELEPEEYQDTDHNVGIIIESLKLLLADLRGTTSSSTDLITFNPGRLKQGFGPEIIYTMNILADRALELLSSSVPDNAKIQIVYHNRGGSTVDRQMNSNSITIGQPFVGGGLTTRPLGSYKIDDKSLLLDGADDDEQTSCTNKENSLFDIQIDEADWYKQVEAVMPDLESADLREGSLIIENWQDYLEATRESQEAIQDFLNQFKSLLVTVSNRIDRHLQVIGDRENTIQTNLKDQISKFLGVWRGYSSQLVKNGSLVEQVNNKANLYESLGDELSSIEREIELRARELNDGKKLRELEFITRNLDAESNELSLRVGLLLTVYARKHCSLVDNTTSH